MSKRYGRNQKRRHRERIAALEVSEQRLGDRAARSERALSTLRSEVADWDEEIRRLLGSYSAFQKDVPTFATDHPIREMPAMERLQPYADYGADIPFSMAMSQHIRMQRYITTIESDPIRWSKLIRFVEADRRGAHVAYSMSDEMVMQAKFGPREMHYLAERIAYELINHANAGPEKSAERKRG